MTCQNIQTLLILIKNGTLWAWKHLGGYGRQVHAKFWVWWLPWDQLYDHWPSPVLICWSFITELVSRNPTRGIPALEDGSLAKLLILYYVLSFSEFLKMGLHLLNLRKRLFPEIIWKSKNKLLLSERSPTTFETLDSLQLSIIEAVTIIDM